MKAPTYKIIKHLPLDLADNPSRYFSYMEERRRKQNARAWLGLALTLGCVAILLAIAFGWCLVVWPIVQLAK